MLMKYRKVGIVFFETNDTSEKENMNSISFLLGSLFRREGWGFSSSYAWYNLEIVMIKRVDFFFKPATLTCVNIFMYLHFLFHLIRFYWYYKKRPYKQMHLKRTPLALGIRLIT